MDYQISIWGHVFIVISFLAVGFYAHFWRRQLRRTTLSSMNEFVLLMVICVVFVVLNMYQVIHELTEPRVTLLGNDALDMITHITGNIVQGGVIIYLLANKIVVSRKPKAGRILAVGAHPDDIEIAAGASLAKMKDAGYQITGLVLTQGAKGGKAERRLGEAVSGAKFLGLDQVEVLDFTDTRLKDQTVELTGAIEERIRKMQPDIIFTHSSHDLHQDHQAVHEATLRAARSAQTTILCYESPSVTPDFIPSYYIEVQEYVEIKIEAIREHWDQREKIYMKPDLVRGKLAFRGGQAKVDYAEGFEIIRMLSSI